jgi:hypothetical protein
MTDEVITIEEPRKKTKSASSGRCRCKEDNAHVEDFYIPTVSGEASLQGVYCPQCYIVYRWLRVEDLKAETPGAEKAKKVVAVATPLQRYFPIVSVNPVEKQPDHVAFLLTKNGLPFTIKVKNSIDRVNAAINNPNAYIGKYAELDYTEVDGSGFPVGSKMISLKEKLEIPHTS